MSAVASTPTHSGSSSPQTSTTTATTTAKAQPEKGESTSLGALTKLVKKTTSTKELPAAPAAATADAAATAQAAIASAEPTAVATETAPAVVANVAPALSEVPAEGGDLTVAASRFLSSASVNAPRAVATAQPTVVAARATVTPLPAVQAGDRLTVPVTFYYCEDTTGGTRRGDGGGFCGAMRNGKVVHDGAAACDVRYLGQRFIIEGDPTGRTYECTDTGGGIADQHRDIWFLGNADGWAWQAVVGRTAVIQILP